MVAAFCFCCLFWLHQRGISRHTCRFYLLLAGAVGKRQGIFDPLSLSNTSPDPLGNPLRRGNVGCRGGQGFRIPVSGAVAIPQLRILCSCLCPALYRSRFSRVVRLMSFVFHWWGGRSFVPAAAFGTGSGRAFFIGGGGAVCSCGGVWDSVGLLFFSALLAPHYSVTDSISPWPVAVWSL